MAYTPTPNSLDYLEIGVADPRASRVFFEELFSWKFTDYGPDYTAYDDGRMAGGFYRLPEGEQANSGTVLVVFYSEDLESSFAKVAAMGVEIIKPIFSFPGGRRFEFLGPDNVKYAIWSL